MKAWTAMIVAGLAVGGLGDVGWALIIGDFGVAWSFWALAVGALTVAAGYPSPATRRGLVMTVGWSVAAAGGGYLLVDALQHAPTPDFPALVVFSSGPLLAAIASLAGLRWPAPPARLGVALGALMAALGGIWWLVLDLASRSFNYVWANAALGLGYGGAAVGLLLASRPWRAPAGSARGPPTKGL